MYDIIKKTKYKIFNISPKKIKYCIFPSKYCDYTQLTSDRLHQHAGIDRGAFKEDQLGYVKINNSRWDSKPGVLFTKLLEYKAALNHYTGKENWKKSKFAIRNVNYIEKYKVFERGFKNSKEYLLKREMEIDKLFISISKKGIFPIDITKNKKLFIDNISLALTKDNKLYFNNRGHHRIAIAKILGIEKIPIKITVAKSKKHLDDFYILNK